MRYHSTRNDQNFVDSAEAVLEGLAPDGGLYMPQQIPALDWKQLLKGSSQEISCAILSALLPDIPNMPRLVANAYTGKFETEDLTPAFPWETARCWSCSGGPPPRLRMWRYPCFPSCSLLPNGKRG